MEQGASTELKRCFYSSAPPPSSALPTPAQKLLSALNLGSALAAHTLALLGGGLDGVHHLHEGRHHLGDLRGLLDERVGSADGGGEVGLVGARAAASLSSFLAGANIASRALADKLALRLGAGDGLLALPVALGGLAHRGADSVGGLALGAAVSRGADGLALGAVLLLAQILRAADVALRLVAVDLALGALGLFAVDLALRALAHRVANGRADRVVALPSALRVAVALHFRGDGEGGKGEHGQSEEQERGSHLLLDRWRKEGNASFGHK